MFFDELDAIVTNRYFCIFPGLQRVPLIGMSILNPRASGGSESAVESRVLATLLTEMDGIDGSDHGVIFIGTTNRLDSIDSALLRKASKFLALLALF